MAIRFRKGRKSPWQVYWNNPITGARESESFATEHEARKHDSLIKHRIMFERESFTPQEEEPEQKHLTLEDCYLLYLREKQFPTNLLEKQLSAMRPILNTAGHEDIRALDYDSLKKIISNLESRRVSHATVYKQGGILRAVLRWASANGYIESIRFPKLPKAVYEKLVPPAPEEMERLISAAQPHIARVIIIGAQCGVRVGPSEMLRLTWADVDFQRGVLHVEGAKKNARSPWREVPIRDELLEVMRHWKEEDTESGCEHIIQYMGKPVESIKRAWDATLRRAGITRRIRPYDLRHAFATNLIAAGVDVGTVAKLMGHSSPAMIFQHYQYVLDGQKKAAVESLPGISYVPKLMCPKKEGLQRLP